MKQSGRATERLDRKMKFVRRKPQKGNLTYMTKCVYFICSGVFMAGVIQVEAACSSETSEHVVRGMAGSFAKKKHGECQK
jgi:hypothetical protein